MIIWWGIVQCARYCLCGFMFYLGYIMLRDGLPYGGWLFVLAFLGLVFGGHNFKCEKAAEDKDADTQA